MPYQSHTIAALSSFAVMLTLFGTSCNSAITHEDRGTNFAEQNLSAAEAQAQESSEVFKIAIIPYLSPQEQQREGKELEEYLANILGVPVSLQVTQDYETSVDLLVEGKVQAAYLGPFSYIKARQRNGNLEPLVAPMEEGTGEPGYTSVIVANNDSGIESLADLKGKRLGLVNQSSTSGYLIPSVQLQKSGIKLNEDLGAIEYSGTHSKNVEVLQTGRVDAIAISKQTYLQAQTSGKLSAQDYQIIWESDPIPNSPIVIDSNLPAALKTNLQQALIDYPEGLVAIDGAESVRYTSVQDENYEPIRQVQQLLDEGN